MVVAHGQQHGTIGVRTHRYPNVGMGSRLEFIGNKLDGLGQGNLFPLAGASLARLTHGMQHAMRGMRGLSHSPRRFAFDDSRGRPPIPPPTVQLSVANPGIVQSASRPGTPLDNAVAEPFFKTLKRESVKERSYTARDEAKQGIFKHIEPYCSRVRMHSTLGCMSPVEYERQYA